MGTIKEQLGLMTGTRRILIIPDGHRRWAREHGVTYTEAYAAGGAKASELIEGALNNGLCTHITLYLIASKNFRERQRKNLESIYHGVTHLFKILSVSPIKDKVTWSVRGHLSRLPSDLVSSLKVLLEPPQKRISQWYVEFLLDYSGEEELRQAITSYHPEYVNCPLFDIVIRTGRILRLSDAPVWESVRADMFLIDKMFPDVDLSDIMRIVRIYLDDKKARRDLAEAELQYMKGARL